VPAATTVPIVLVALWPWTMVTLVGNARIAKSEGAVVTVTVTDVL
jgi:hypothetical protein